MPNLFTLNIFTVLKVCWMTAVAAVIVSIKPQVIVSWLLAVGWNNQKFEP